MEQAMRAIQRLRFPAGLRAGALGRWSSKLRPGPIGLDLSLEKLHLLQLQRGPSETEIRAALSAPYPDEREAMLGSPRALRRLLKGALRSRPFAGKRVVTCLPSDKLRLMLVNYRPRDAEGEAATLFRTAMERVEGKPEDWVVDYVPAGSAEERDGEKTALVALARREKVLSYLDLLRGAGLDVEALEIGPVAIRRLVGALHRDDPQRTVLVLNFGQERSYLTAIAEGHLILDRETAFGEKDLIEKVSTSLEMPVAAVQSLIHTHGVSPSPEQSVWQPELVGSTEIAEAIAEIIKPMCLALAEEVGKVLIYTASQTRGASVELVYVLGSIARWPGAESLLNGFLSLPVRIVNPSAAFTVSPGADMPATPSDLAALAIAAGNALRETTG